MNTQTALKLNMDMGEMITMMYLEDMTDEELMHRPAPGANHIKWQLGHLIASDHDLVNRVCPGVMPDLPAGFAAKYTKETAANDNPEAFDSKEDLLRTYKQQRHAAVTALESMSDQDFDKESGFDYAPNAGAIFSLLGGHYLMHAGQWAVIRRQLGRRPLF